MTEGVKRRRKLPRATVLIVGLLALGFILKSAPRRLGFPETIAFLAVWSFFAWRAIVLIVEPRAREVIEKVKRR
jgi:hypothetical protein